MEDNNWEEGLKNMLSDYKPEGLQPDWDDFAQYLSIHEKVTEWEENEAFDESLKETLSGSEATTNVEGWDRIESSLNEADKQFDEQIRHRISYFEPPSDPRWSLILRRLSGVEFLRTKLIAFKVVEVAAVFLLLFTVVKMGQMGKLPFETPLFENTKDGGKSSSFRPGMASAEETGGSNSTVSTDVSSAFTKDINSESSNKDNIQAEESPLLALSNGIEQKSDISPKLSEFSKIASTSGPIRPTEVINPRPFVDIKSSNEKNEYADAYALEVEAPDLEDLGGSENKSFFKKLQVANILNTVLSPIRWNKDKKSLPKLAYVKPRSRTFTEFGIVSQLDYNKLQMPEDRLFNVRMPESRMADPGIVVFQEQGINSSSIGGGFTFALAHPRWAIETGMIYHPKSFKPERGLKVGEEGSKEYSTVEFEAIRLQLVSIPLNFRYKFYNIGPLKMYGLAGGGLHLVAQSDIDVPIKNHFIFLAPGENPNHNPDYELPISESKRIREHFLDKSPFSTKSFLCLNAGAGLEYSVTENKSLFFQSALQYQLPNVKFSNNNGKNLRSISFQAGVRTPLGN